MARNGPDTTGNVITALAVAAVAVVFGLGILIGHEIGKMSALSALDSAPAFVQIRCDDLCAPNGGVKRLESNARPRHRCKCQNGAFFSDGDLTK